MNNVDCRTCETELPEGALFCGECGSSVTSTRVPRSHPTPAPPERDTIQREERAGLEIAFLETMALETAPPETLSPETFVLRFSSGENASVTGWGLLGRKPMPQPGEEVDHLVRVTDRERSVSKTHLEFGQEDGRFWVSDRYSGNGSVIHEPGSAPHRCEPGRRYFLTRGTRVDIGEQFLVLY